jgi:hypothetical protein
MSDVDKVMVTGFYDESGHCYSVEIHLNYDGISREDLTEVIRAAFNPAQAGIEMPRAGQKFTFRHTELGNTAEIPAVNGSRTVPGEVATLSYPT